MARQRAYLHIGLPHSGGDLLDAALREHADRLAGPGVDKVRLPARSVEEMFNAAVEIRREHRAWGLRRKDVEGAWALLCRRAIKNKDTVVLGHDLLAGCTSDEIALLVDQLPGCAVHVIVTVGAPDPRVSLFPDDHDLGSVLERWSVAVKSPDRVHVVVVQPGAPQTAWRAFGEIIGFDAALPLPSTPAPMSDAAALRLLAESAGDLATYDDLTSVGEDWAKLVADSGYDVHGDLSALAPAAPSADGGEDVQLAVIGEALGDTVAELVRLRERATALEERNAKLERKRRSLKRKLALVD